MRQWNCLWNARSHDAGFATRDEDGSLLGEIVRRVDGVPLAIELAAARVKALGLATIASCLDERFRLLANGSRAGPRRQQTMQALIAWSYDLLNAPEQTVFRRLGIFTGGWSLAGAEAVCGGEGAGDVLESLAALVEKSLVVKQCTNGVFRYRFLESTRAFALQALGEEERRTIALEHARWCAALLERGEAKLAVETLDAGLATLGSEVDNIRAALEWCERNGEFELGARISSATGTLFCSKCLVEDGARWVRRSLQHLREEQNPRLVARLYCNLAKLSDDAKTRLDAAKHAVELAERTTDVWLLAVANLRYAVALYVTGKLQEALAANERACTAFREHAAPALSLQVPWALQHRSWMFVELGRFDDARECLEEAVSIFRAVKATREAQFISSDLAELEFAAGNPLRALEIVDEALPHAADTGDLQLEAVLICNRAGYLVNLGECVEARATAREALDLALKSVGMERALHVLEHLAAARAGLHKGKSAAILAGFVQAQYAKSGYERETTERSSHDILVATLPQLVSDDALARLMTRGSNLSLEQAVDEATRTAALL